MDVNTLMKLFLSSGSTNTLSQMTGTSKKEVATVLTSILPMLLNGASSQATNKATEDNFNKALDHHGKADTKDLGKFLMGVDKADGAKIVQHLLGAKADSQVEAAAKESGLPAADVKKILVLVAPLLMAILGQQKKKPAGSSALMQALLLGKAGKGINAASILGTLGKLI